MPHEKVEDTAEAIAAGDLSARLPAAKSEAVIAKLANKTEAKISRLRKLQRERGVRTRLSGEFIC